jgi:hypothetical protein
LFVPKLGALLLNLLLSAYGYYSPLWFSLLLLQFVLVCLQRLQRSLSFSEQSAIAHCRNCSEDELEAARANDRDDADHRLHLLDRCVRMVPG